MGPRHFLLALLTEDGWGAVQVRTTLGADLIDLASQSRIGQV